MAPIIAILGRPNVGKSTLFNRLTESRAALVADRPGLTRDRHVGRIPGLAGQPFLVDTGGLGEAADPLAGAVEEQAMQAAAQAELVLLLVDARSGLTAADSEVAARLRQLDKPLLLVVNKAEGLPAELAAAEFHSLGVGEPLCVSAAHGDGMRALLQRLESALPAPGPAPAAGAAGGPVRVAVIGRPNAGKSTLVNRMLGEPRVIVSEVPGTTRDSIEVPFSRDGVDYLLVDTAGVRRRARVEDHLEKLSVMQTLQSLRLAEVAIVLVDAREGLGEQDLRIIGYAMDRGCGLLIGVNKWDGLAAADKERVRAEADRRLGFAAYAPLRFISALHGTGVGDLFPLLREIHAGAFPDVTTGEVNAVLERAVAAHQPPLVRGQRIKLRYAHLGGVNPPTIVVHGTRVSALPDAYRRYLERCLRDALGLTGNPVRIELRQGDNPFKGRRNRLTRRQLARRKRVVQHDKRRR